MTGYWWIFKSFITLVLIAANINAQQLAFPGAEGFGAKAVGGRGGKIIFVENLKDNGFGSLRAAIGDSVPRIVIFRVSGTIELQSYLVIKYPFITIAGQTAPGEGICLKNYPLKIYDCHDVIIRGIRVRPGIGSRMLGSQIDGIQIDHSKNVILDHCSASWTVDEILNTYHQTEDITVQWCIFSEALNNSIHEKGTHGYGATIGGTRASYHHNLFAHNAGRNPSIGGDNNNPTELLDFSNNVVFNWEHRSCDGKPRTMNFVANYYRSGPATENQLRKIITEIQSSEKYGYTSKWFIADNFIEGYPELSADNWSGAVKFGTGTSMEINRVYTPFENANYRTRDASVVFQEVLAEAGVTIPGRDVVDKRVLKDVQSGIPTSGNGLVDKVDLVGGWPTLYSIPAPIDSDADGMPDFWEDQFDLNRLDPADNMRDDDGDGYVNIEEYINNSDPTGNAIPMVYVGTSDSRAYEADGESGSFTFYRTGNLNSSLEINYTLSGTATAGIDYSNLSGSVMLESGQSSTQIAITPQADDVIENTEFIILNLIGSVNSYRVGCPDAALIAILDAPGIKVETPGEKLVRDFRMEQNFPNPFNSATQVNFNLPVVQKVTLKIYDMTGRYITTLIDREVESGFHQVQWNGTDTADKMVSSGIYFARFTSPDYDRTIKLILQR